MQRLKQRADFERALNAGPNAVVARSPHFVLHHVSEPASAGAPPPGQLSTGAASSAPVLVDEVSSAISAVLRVGTVLPKRWARRSVTRSLLKRQVFAAFERRCTDMPAGVWVLRLRSTFDRERFPSAASEALQVVVRRELDGLLDQALTRLRRSLLQPAGAAQPRPRGVH